MRVLVAGALGDLGIEVSRLLRERGHEVWGLTRSPRRAEKLSSQGVRSVVANLLDSATTRRAVADAQPDGVVSVPTALPQRGPIRPRDMHAYNRPRVEGTRHLVEASVGAGVKRFVSESIVAIYGYGDTGRGALHESSPTARRAPLRAVQAALDAVHEQEAIVLDAGRSGAIEGLVVRIGFYYGREVGSTRFMATLLRRRAMLVTRKRGAMPWIEISDAAAGVVAALERGRSGEIYNIVADDSVGLSDFAHELARHIGSRPPREVPTWVIRIGARYAALMGETRLYVSNRKAKEELGWQPRFPTLAEGLADVGPRLRPP